MRPLVNGNEGDPPLIRTDLAPSRSRSTPFPTPPLSKPPVTQRESISSAAPHTPLTRWVARGCAQKFACVEGQLPIDERPHAVDGHETISDEHEHELACKHIDSHVEISRGYLTVDTSTRGSEGEEYDSTRSADATPSHAIPTLPHANTISDPIPPLPPPKDYSHLFIPESRARTHLASRHNEQPINEPHAEYREHAEHGEQHAVDPPPPSTFGNSLTTVNSLTAQRENDIYVMTSMFELELETKLKPGYAAMFAELIYYFFTGQGYGGKGLSISWDKLEEKYLDKLF
jgi:hypothetical protein